MAYATVEQFVDFAGWTREVPEFISGQTPQIEEVDTSGTLADGSEIYLDYNAVITDTLILAFGPDTATLTDLTVTTDYTVTEDGKITITAAGAIAIGANNVYAREYKYVYIDGRTNIKPSTVSTFLESATDYIDQWTESTFETGVQVLREEHAGQGFNHTKYYPYHNPLSVVKTQVATAIDSSTTTLVLDTTSGLLAGDYLSIGTEVLVITTIDSATDLTVVRGALGSTAVSHAVDEWVVNVVVESSPTREGFEPRFDILQFRDDWDVSVNSGFIQLFLNRNDDYLYGDYPKDDLMNRVRVTYTFGRNTVPFEVVEATKLYTLKLFQVYAIGSAQAEGSTDYTGIAHEVLDQQIEKLLMPFKNERYEKI